jgi:hypothetical protein
MAAVSQTIRDVQANNDHYRVTNWTLPPGATTGLPSHEFSATLLSTTTGQLLLKRNGREQLIDVVAWQPREIEGGPNNELVNTSRNEFTFTIMEYK